MADDNARLVLHCGGRQVTREELDAVEAPPATATWYPVRHATVYETVRAALTDSGFVVQRAQFGLSRSDQRMFATLDLTSVLATGVTLSVGVRNSTDKSFPLGFCAGSRVFVCDNLAFRSDLTVAKKHTKFGATRFQGEIARAVKTLSAFQRHETERVLALQQHALGDEAAEALMLRSFEGGLVSYRALPAVIREWRSPKHDEFKPRTAWSLLNAYTTVLAPRARANAQEYARQTMRLGGLIDAAAGIRPFVVPEPNGNGRPEAVQP
jgi:hypothetical protein